MLTESNNPLATASAAVAGVAWLVGGLGICALLFLFAPASFCTWVIFFGGNVAAVMFGHQGRSQIRASGGEQSGGRLAAIGLALGWTGIALNLLFICLAVVLAVTAVLVGPEFTKLFPWFGRGLQGF